jgi:phosphoglycolate phosphatase-like HAD superfamily hydrolase
MADHIAQLRSFGRTKDYFIGIDSDGCAFDTMEVKHKACFYPMIVKHYDAAGVARYVRDVWDFVNLYSTSRGCNRFLAMLRTLDLLGEREDVRRAGYCPPDASSLRAWTEQETKLGNPALEARCRETGDAFLARVLDCSLAINKQVASIVHNVPPFPRLPETLAELRDRADLMVVSSTPLEALEKEWAEHDIAQYVGMICGQELGSKKEHLRYAACEHYEAERILMIGDAPGDMKAAKDNGVLFYPINPGAEAASWARFADDAAGRFFDGAYAGEYEAKVIAEFKRYLPSTPPWKA